MKANILLLGLGGYIAYKFISKSSAVNKLGYFVSRVSLRFSGITPILDIVLAIQNPTGTSLNIGSIIGDLYVNDNYLANLSGYQLTQIKPTGVTLFPLSARLSLSGLFGEVKEIVNSLASGDANVLLNQTLKFKGYVYAEGITMPLQFQYKVL